MTSKELDPLKSKSASVGVLPVSPTLDLNQGAAQTRGTKPQSFPQAAIVTTCSAMHVRPKQLQTWITGPTHRDCSRRPRNKATFAQPCGFRWALACPDPYGCTALSPVVALRDVSPARNKQGAFESKRTSNGRQDRLAQTRMTQSVSRRVIRSRHRRVAENAMARRGRAPWRF
jgi:hypothetical protein